MVDEKHDFEDTNSAMKTCLIFNTIPSLAIQVRDPWLGRQDHDYIHAFERTQYLVTQRLFLPICLCHNMVECSSVSQAVSENKKIPPKQVITFV